MGCPEMQTTTEYIKQYFKLKIFAMLNRRVLVKSAIQSDKHVQFKILVTIFRKTLPFKKINIFSLKYWLVHSVAVSISEKFYKSR